MSNPFLYSYRRCPYAMRARMALYTAQIQCDVHEIDFKNKPAHMLEISPKGTVPVLETIDGQIIDESFDIVFWSLEKNDPLGYLKCDLEKAGSFINENDTTFKASLDRYKYANRFPDEDCSNSREEGLVFLNKLNEILSDQKQLLSDRVSVTDICIFPFVRQFANVDREWFDRQNLPFIQKWLLGHLTSDLFVQIMKKHKDTPYLLL